MQISRFLRFTVLCLIIKIWLNNTDSWAIDEEPSFDSTQDANVTYVLPDIVVTSPKKSQSERLQDIPTAISVYTGKTIEDTIALDLTDIGEFAPNVRLTDIGTFPNTSMFYIRGMGVSSSIPSDEPAVGVFVDGMYLGVNTGSLIDLFDVETVEVLRGPQGTLFGRNVTGGAVVVRHRRPTGELSIRGKTTIGSYEWVEQHVVVEAPILETLSGKVGAVYRNKDGYFSNTAVSGDRVGEDETWLIRPIFTWKPMPELEVTLISEFSRFDGDGVVSRSIFERDLQDVATDLKPEGAYNIEQSVLDINWNIGPGKLTSITGWRQFESTVDIDVDGSGRPIFHSVDNMLDQDQISEEIRYALVVDDRAELTTGLSYFRQDIANVGNQNVIFQGFNEFGRGDLEHTAVALFAQSDIHISDSLTFTLGVRQTWEEKDVKVASFGAGCGANPCPYDFIGGDEWNFTSGRAGINWYAHENNLLYTSWSRSFRSGGFNMRNSLPASPGPYDEEEVDAYELGLKSEWLEGRLRTNIAIFYNDFTDLQRVVLSPALTQETLNVADATISGFEAEVNFLPFDGLRIDASLGYVDADYDKYDGLDVNGDNIPDPELAENLDFFGVPDWTAFLGGEYTIPLSWKLGGKLTLRASASYTDQHPITERNDIIQDSYTLVNASISYFFDNENLSISVFGRNLLDERYAFLGIGPFNLEWAAQPGEIYGIDLTYAF